MGFPFTYTREYDEIITDFTNFSDKLIKSLPKIKEQNLSEGQLIFSTNSSLVPVNYEITLGLTEEKKLTVEINLTNLMLVDIIIGLFLLFLIKNLVVLIIVWIGIISILYFLNVLHLTTVLEHHISEILEGEKIICQFCGAEIPKTSQVCPVCGADLTRTATDDTIEINYILKTGKTQKNV